METGQRCQVRWTWLWVHVVCSQVHAWLYMEELLPRPTPAPYVLWLPLCVSPQLGRCGA